MGTERFPAERERATEQQAHRQLKESSRVFSDPEYQTSYLLKSRKNVHPPLGAALFSLMETEAPDSMLIYERKRVVDKFRSAFNPDFSTSSSGTPIPPEKVLVVFEKLRVIFDKMVRASSLALHHLGQSGPHTANPIKAAKGLDNATILDMCVNYARAFTHEEMRLREQIAPLAKRMFRQLTVLFPELKPLLPNMRKRVTSVRWHLADELSQVMRLDDEWAGTYRGNRRTIEISNAERGGFQAKTILHELVHVISGHTFIRETMIEENVDIVDDSLKPHFEAERKIDVTPQRVGTLYYPTGRFFWLNEALTEDVTQKLLTTGDAIPPTSVAYVFYMAAGKKEFFPTYVAERKLLENLKSRGRNAIPDELFLRAFFENYERGAAAHGESPVPHWQALRRAINASYSSTFLVQLDRYVKSFGAQRANKVINEEGGWKKIDAHSFSGGV